MAWDKNEPTGDGDFSLRDDAIRANFAAIETCIGETNLSDGETLFDTSDGHDHDGTNSKKVTKQLGDWVSKSKDTVYQATTDGFVCAFTPAEQYSYSHLTGYSDSSNPPTTIRMEQSSRIDMAYFRVGIMFLVNKGDYWKVTQEYYTQAITVYWKPLGS